MLGFQSASLKTFVVSFILLSDMMAAKELVTITRLTLGAYLAMAWRMPFVPLIAGSNNSVRASVNLKWKGDAVCCT